jgi:alanine racemase
VAPASAAVGSLAAVAALRQPLSHAVAADDAHAEAIAARGAWLRVDLAGVQSNLDLVRSLVPSPTQVMAVVKADAYGHGGAQVAAAALAWGCEWLAVGNVLEGIELRRAGIAAPCLVLAPMLPHEAEICLSYALTPSLADTAGARTLADAVGAAGGGRVDVHLMVDAGMGRFGVAPGRLVELGEAVAALPPLRIAGVYTHFANPSDPVRTRRELQAFLSAKDALVRATGATPIAHAAGSEAAVLLPETQLDLVRIGNLMYGYWGGPAGRLPRGGDGRPPAVVLELRARVIALQDIAAGSHLGYGDFRTGRALRVAVLPVGAADGVGLRSVQTGAGLVPALLGAVKDVIRSAARRWRPHAVIRGERAPVVGRVGMQFLLVDVTAIAGVAVGDEASVPGVRATAARGLPRAYVG